MKLNNKVITALILIVVVIVVLVFGYTKLWWFRPAYSDRQTVQTFLHDVSVSNDKKAYALTTSTFQSKNSYVTFQSYFNYYSGDKLGISYTSYAKKSDGSMLLVGTVNDKTTKDTTQFAIGLVGDKISTVSIFSQPSGTK